MKIVRYRFNFWIIGLFAALAAAWVNACSPLPVLLYPADEVYQSKGLEVPELPEDSVAWLNGEFIPKVDFQEFLYRKVGFESDKRRDFVLKRCLINRFKAQGIDAEHQKEIISDHLFRFDSQGIYTNCAEWVAMAEKRKNMKDPYPSLTALRVENTYLKALYVFENWDEIYALGLDDFGVDYDIFDIQGEDAEVKQIVKLNNAVEILYQYSTVIDPHILHDVLAGQDLNIPGLEDEYKEWLSARYGTVYLLETYLGMLLSFQYGEAHHLQLSEKTIREEFKTRVDEYKMKLESCRKEFPSTCIPLAVSTIYTDFIMQEIRDDLYKSKVHRNATPLKPHEVLLRFYQQYGFEGQQCEVHEIYKWVRKRNLRKATPESEEMSALAQARVRSELNAIREAILTEGTESFFTYAITENDGLSQQKRAGEMDIRSLACEQVLRDLTLDEVSPVLKEAPINKLYFSWLSESSGDARVYHGISKTYPSSRVDLVTYQKDCAAIQEELSGLQVLLEIGASIDTLAEEHSDSFDSTRGDISKTYQSDYGFSFAKEINSIPDGGTKIIQSLYGINLVQVSSRVITPYTAEVKKNIIQQYNDELADQNNRYVVVEKLFHEVNPYFK
jgi:hypothetical protein